MIISRLLLAGVAAFGVSSATFAADLIIDEEPGIIVEDEPVNFEGLYVGVHIGGGWGFADHIVGGFPNNDIDLSGAFAGVQLGGSFHAGDMLVLGAEVDASWSGISGTCTPGAIPGVCGFTTTQDINWMASARGNIGFDAGAFMPYLTAGLVVAEGTRSSLGGSASATHVGWTAGVGVRVAATENVSLDFQYRYNDLGTQTYMYGANPDVNITLHTVRAGINFEF